MPIPDRQKQRREYLRQKTRAYGKLTGGTVTWFCIFIFTLLCGALTISALIATAVLQQLQALLLASLFALFTVLGAALFLRMGRFVEKAQQEEAQIAYVPPVTPKTLPAEEVLVRASLQPEQEQSAILLRASGSTETPAEELLRATHSSAKE